MSQDTGAFHGLSCARVPRIDRGLAGRGAGDAGGHGAAPAGLAGLPWARAAALGPLILADGSAAAEQTTTVRVAWDVDALYVRFECADRDAWGTFRQRNDPLYQEEAVEVFLAPAMAGEAAPRRYWELEVSPLGVLLAARVENPTGRRSDLVADTSWPCAGLAWQVEAAGAAQDWRAALAIPWQALEVELAGGLPPRRWRANFYRIERPRGSRAEFSCWSPTLTEPPDFHRPDRFGLLELDG